MKCAMNRRRGLVVVACLMLLCSIAVAGDLKGALELSKDDRILVLAPHPDDEVIACAGVIQKALDMGLPLKVVFLTYGDNNEWSFAVYRKHVVLAPSAARAMGEVRHGEALAAADVLGVARDRLVFLGYPDFRTLDIWTRHWGAEPACRGMLNQATAVPYADALRPNTPYKGEEIIRDISTLLAEFRPTKIFVSHPADHNPDHRALYLFTQVALWQLEDPVPAEVFPSLVHFQQWPQPRGLDEALTNDPPDALAQAAHWTSFALSPAESVKKLEALKKHWSQYEYSAKYLLSFVRANELFGGFAPILLSAATGTVSYAGSIPSPADTDLFTTEEEKVLFVGIEEQRVGVEKGCFVMSVRYTRPLSEAVTLSVHAFGFRHDRPFEDMPKLQVLVDAASHRVMDQGRVLPKSSCTVTHSLRLIEVRIPLEVLGRPEKVFCDSRTQLGEIPLDWAAWRICDLGGAK